MLWCGASWVKRLQFWLNWGVGRLAAWEGLVFFPGQKIPIYLIVLLAKPIGFEMIRVTRNYLCHLSQMKYFKCKMIFVWFVRSHQPFVC